jgi:radical SAM protein with 4Fe4S-binding SPASM domain
MLQEGLYKNLIDELHPTLTYLILYFQGEPYLNTRFLDLVKYAHSRKIYTCTSTNAHYLNDENARHTIESGLDRLIISIDGTTQDTYESYRIGGSLDKVIEGTKNIVKWKRQLKSSKPYVIFQFLVVKPNEHQVEEVKKLAAEIGVDEVKFKTAQVYDYENGNPLIPENEKYSRYRKLENGRYEFKNAMKDNCWKMWHSCVVTWDGKVVPCCFDKDASHELGNVKTTSFKEVWRSNRYQNFRSALLTSRKEIDICSNCSEGTQVWA